MKYIIYRLLIVLISLLSVACTREFDDNSDYKNNEIEPVLGDNSLLYSKIFRNQSTGTFLWFGLRNEVSNFTKPILSISSKRNDVNQSITIDLRGRLYQYNKESEEITFLNIPLNLFGQGDLISNVVCSLEKKQKDGCNDLTDAAMREQCQRTYLLVLKHIYIKDIDAMVRVGESYTYQTSTVVLPLQAGQELYLTN